MKVGDYIKVTGQAYRVPPQASRASMEAMMAANHPNAEKYRKSASGLATVTTYGQITAMVDGMVAYRDLASTKTDIASEDCVTVLAQKDMPKRIRKRLEGPKSENQMSMF